MAFRLRRSSCWVVPVGLMHIVIGKQYVFKLIVQGSIGPGLEVAVVTTQQFVGVIRDDIQLSPELLGLARGEVGIGVNADDYALKQLLYVRPGSSQQDLLVFREAAYQFLRRHIRTEGSWVNVVSVDSGGDVNLAPLVDRLLGAICVG